MQYTMISFILQQYYLNCFIHMYIGQKLIIIPLVVVSVGHAVYGLLVPWGYTPVEMSTVGKWCRSMLVYITYYVYKHASCVYV